jgi:hypothetical protein
MKINLKFTDQNIDVVLGPGEEAKDGRICAGLAPTFFVAPMSAEGSHFRWATRSSQRSCSVARQTPYVYLE